MKEHMAEFRAFNFKSLYSTGLEIADFIANGLFRFSSYQCDFYPNLIREFYANLFVDDLDEEAFDNSILKSKMNGVEVYVDEKLLSKFFELSDEGWKCMEAELTRKEQGETVEIHHVHY